MTTELFNPDPSTTSNVVTTANDVENALEILVGDDKKFKDAEALAKGKLESDRFILQLQKENAAARERLKELDEQLKERITLEEFMDEFRNTQNDAANTVTNPQHVSRNDVSHQNQQPDINKLIDERLMEQRRRELIQANVATSVQEVAKAWGPSYQSKLEARVHELGLSKEFVESVAQSSPKAFLELIGIGRKQETSRSDPNIDVPPRTDVQTRTVDIRNDNTVRNQVYWNKLRKQDPKAFHSEKMTAQRHRDAQRLGEAFFRE